MGEVGGGGKSDLLRRQARVVVEEEEVSPRTIPFRSASFSQVDVNSEGKYVRQPPLTLKPTAFCLNNSSYASTLPRIHHPPPPRTPDQLPESFLPLQTLDENEGDSSSEGTKLKVPGMSVSGVLPSNKHPTDVEGGGCGNGGSTRIDDSGQGAQPGTLGEEQSSSAEELGHPEKSTTAGAELPTCNPNDSAPHGVCPQPRLEEDSVKKVDGFLSTNPVGEGKSNTLESEKVPDIHSNLSLEPLNSSDSSKTSLEVGGSEPPPTSSESIISPKVPSTPPTTQGSTDSSSSPAASERVRVRFQIGGESSEGLEDCMPQSAKRLEGKLVSLKDGKKDPVVSSGDEDVFTLPRQSSGQSDASDEGASSSGGGTSTSVSAVGVKIPSSPPSVPSWEISRTGSLSGRHTPGRFYKRPLRGPYGEMLEAEMNKVLISPRRTAKELDSLEFFRESKSSSPTPGDPTVSLSNPLLMASLDDLNLTNKQAKHPNNPRCRKISTNLPLIPSTHYSTGEEKGVLTFHQRTSSSPSQLLYTGGHSSLMKIPTPQLNASPRGHVLAELLETEKSYVDSLRILVTKYMEPLKCSDFIDSGLVDEIFFQIPAILWHHERLLEAFQRRVTDDTQSIGDVLLDTFRQNSLLDCYAHFVKNWKNAKGSLKMAVASKPPLARFLEANSREHKGKLSVDSLLIMPIQRIPRYELLLKELVKHTDPGHEDHSRLILVLEKIKKFAVHIDCASVDPNDNRDMEIEGWTAGLGHLVRQDLVSLAGNVRKERALFLFADSILIASIKRKTTMRKTSSNQWAGAANLEGCKFKLLNKVPLTEVHVLEQEECVTKGCSHSDEMDDLKMIHKMMDLANVLKCPHMALDESLRDLASSLKHHCDNSPDQLLLQIKTSDSDSAEVLRVLFGSSEKRASWLDSFQDTLGKFVRYGFGKMPNIHFLHALAIRKTRAGLQLSCAAPVFLHTKGAKSLEMSDVWVANSDGYVGQICILTLHPEPAITSCNGVCNSRISCIVSVPPPVPPSFEPDTLLGYDSEEDSHRHHHRPGHKSPQEHSSVWLGTEDGVLHVYDCSDSVRVKKNRHKVQHKSPLNCIVYFDGRVFVSLANGDVAVYSRNPNGKGWMINEPSWMTIGSALNPVTKMVCVSSTVWCAFGSQVKVYGESGGMLELLQCFQVTSGDVPRGISLLAPAEDFVWIALQGSSTLRCYSSRSFECIAEGDVANEVSSILAGCDDIIRQHKSACLRITALLVAPDKTLWIGTSAGVILTLTAMGPSQKVTPLGQGHTGQVRFLTCCMVRDSCVVISGGDGMEEFRPTTPLLNNNNASFSGVMSSLVGDSSVDLSGREDSTNHLLIWKVPRPL